jgi:hypothetical protein
MEFNNRLELELLKKDLEILDLFIRYLDWIKMTCSNSAGHFYFSNIQEIKIVRKL